MSVAYIQVQCMQKMFMKGSKQYEPWSDCSLGSSLIWVHIVCNIGHPVENEQMSGADDKSCDMFNGKKFNISFDSWTQNFKPYFCFL